MLTCHVFYPSLPKSPGFFIFFRPSSQNHPSLCHRHIMLSNAALCIIGLIKGYFCRGEFLVCLPILRRSVLLLRLLGFDPLDLLLHSLVHSFLQFGSVAKGEQSLHKYEEWG